MILVQIVLMLILIKRLLTYAYSGNKLTSVNTNGSQSSCYLYNENGNMTFDGRKGINISYNILNLPEKISKGSQSILYIYSAAGEKLAMEFGSSLIYYRGGFIYSGNSLDRIIHEEGSVIKSSGGYNYYYALKDHLGSTRVLCKGSGTSLITEQTTEYYPFGLAYSYNSVDKNPYLFSGKEYQNEVIDGTKLELYDFGSRFYDTEIGRWSAVDPALQLVSPYGHCMNNPVCCVDPDGEFVHIIIGAATGGAAFMGAGGAAGGVGGFAAGFAGGAVGAVFSMPVQNLGNAVYFGDPLMTAEQYGLGILAGGALGGVINGGLARLNGRSFFTGEVESPNVMRQSIAIKMEKPKIKLHNDGKSELKPFADNNRYSVYTKKGELPFAAP